jgi:hypothetical protein
MAMKYRLRRNERLIERDCTFSFLVPVHVHVRNGQVQRVRVIDETPVSNPEFVDGCKAYLQQAVKAANENDYWPSWEFGY